MSNPPPRPTNAPASAEDPAQEPACAPVRAPHRRNPWKEAAERAVTKQVNPACAEFPTLRSGSVYNSYSNISVYHFFEIMGVEKPAELAMAFLDEDYKFILDLLDQKEGLHDPFVNLVVQCPYHQYTRYEAGRLWNALNHYDNLLCNPVFQVLRPAIHKDASRFLGLRQASKRRRTEGPEPEVINLVAPASEFKLVEDSKPRRWVVSASALRPA